MAAHIPQQQMEQRRLTLCHKDDACTGKKAPTWLQSKNPCKLSFLSAIMKPEEAGMYAVHIARHAESQTWMIGVAKCSPSQAQNLTAF